MPRGYYVSIVSLAALWGSTFMFVEIALEELDPVAIIEARLLLASVLLTAVLLARWRPREALRATRLAGRGLVVLAVINCIIPYTLIAWGQVHIDSSIAAIGNAAVPIFVGLLVIRLIPSERLRGRRLVGVLVGFVGVGVLVGFEPQGGWWGALGTLAVVGATFSYAVANIYTQRRLRATSPIVIAAGSSVLAAILLLPASLAWLPQEIPSVRVLASLAGLAVIGHAAAHLVFYRMLVVYGASRTSLVTYLTPLVAVFYGVWILGEPVRANAVLALVLVLSGIGLASARGPAPGAEAAVPPPVDGPGGRPRRRRLGLARRKSDA